MRKLLPYTKGYGKEFLLGPLLKLAEATLELLLPYVILAMVNVGIAGENRRYIVIATLILIGMGFFGLLFSVSAQFFCAKAAVGVCSRIREALFAHVQSLTYREIDRLGRSTLITRLTSDVNQLQTGINLTLRLFLRSPFIVFGAMIMAFTIDVEAALVFAVLIPVLALVVFGVLLASMPLYKAVQTRLDGIVAKLRENLTGVRMLRALCKEESETEAFNENNDRLRDAQNLVGRVTALMNPLTYVILNLAIAALMYSGALKVQYGALTQGAVLALYNYMSQILVELIKLANLIINMTKSLASAKRIEAVFVTVPSMTVNSDAPGYHDDTAIRFDHVTFRYGKGGEPALNDITFSAEKGETVGIIGGTGSGKTTLINLVCRFYDASDGNVYVDGRHVSSCRSEDLLKRIGIVPQRAELFRGTIRSNLTFGKEDATDNELWDALETAQSKDFVLAREGGLDAPVEQGGRNLSGGQKQRLTIARALVRRPSLLILDDSSSALDYATDLALRRGIAGLDYRPTVLIVSQRAAALSSADKILVLDEGILVGVGTHRSLYDTCDIYREICHSQHVTPEGRGEA